MASPFLSNLGISVFEQARSPTPEAFPPAFNPNNKLLWQEALNEYPPGDSAMTDWARAIQQYVEVCEQAGVFPFQQTHMARNDQIHYFLQSARHTINRYLNRGILKELTIRKTTQKVTVTDEGFIIDVAAWVFLKDPTFPDYLVKMPYPHFSPRRSEDGRFFKKLGPGIEMYVYNEGVRMSQRWHIGYTIHCNVFPDAPGMETPSKAELESFILQTLWMPILRELRPIGLQYRLI